MRTSVATMMATAIALTNGAAGATPSARLVYSRAVGAESCPDEEALRRAVATRVGYDPLFAWAKETVVVQIWRAGGRYRSRVQVVDMQGIAKGTRELSSDRDACSELFDATALAISIALDASAQKETDGVPPPSAPETPPVPPVPLVPPAPPPPPTDEPAPEPARPTPATPVSRVFAGVDLLGSVGTAPSPAFLGFRTRSLSAAIEARVDAPASAEKGGDRITSWLFAAGVAPCLHVGPGLACLLASLGQVRASGEVSAPSQGTALFAVVGARLGAELALTEALFLRVHADLLVDLDPPTVRLNKNDADEWDAPTFAATLGAGLLVRFP